MKENRITRRKLYWKLFALIVLSVAALLIRQPQEVAAFDCDSNYTNALSNCLVDAYWHNIGTINEGSVTPQQNYACNNTSFTGNSSCLSEDGFQEACDNIFTSCSYLTGTDVGNCYSSYASCESGHMQKHYAMIQCAVPDTSPCREQAWSDFWACRDNPGDFNCPEGVSDCCLGIERAELATCNCD